MKEQYPIGIVVEALAGTRYKVQMPNGDEVICYLAGKMRVKNVQVIVGDKVEVKLDPAGGHATNRIVWRHRN